jgi:UDP-GlcNAc:undecaprenyl-phosphate GlcNAc-1-phosphate transferase
MNELISQANQSVFLEGFRYPLLTGVIALVISVLLTPLVRKLAFAVGAVDDPKRDNRRVHKEPLPRWGGIAIFGGFLLAVVGVLPFAYRESGLIFPPYLIGILGIGALVVIMGALDDLHQYSAKVQLLFLILAGVAITFFGMSDKSRVLISGFNWPPFSSQPGVQWIEFGMWAIPITAFYIFVVTKTMDTIDGIDGLASGIAAIAASTISIIATYEGQPRVALVAAALAGASLGFLRHNYNPAKIIMGTGGAQLLGFVLASLSIVGAMKTAAAVMIIVPMFVFGVPLFDAVQVVIRRKLSGVPITQADKRHIHHQLLDRGLSQRQAVWVLYSIAAVLCAALVFVVRSYG